jgi:hypothetical protein
MDNGYQPGQGAFLSRGRVFQLVAEELFRKGFIDGGENDILRRLTRFLGLEGPRAIAIARAARVAVAALASATPTDAARMYERVLREILAVGPLRERDLTILAALRRLFGLPDSLHERLVAGVPVAERAQPPAPAQPDVSDVPRAFAEATELGRAARLEDAERIVTACLAIQPRPERLPELYRAALDGWLAAALDGDDTDHLLRVVHAATRLSAAGTPHAARWAACGDLIEQVARRLAGSGRWEAHTRAVEALDAVPERFVEPLAGCRARVLADAMLAVLAEGRAADAAAWHAAFARLQLYAGREDVRAPHAEAVGATLEHLARDPAADAATLARLQQTLQRLVRDHPGDRTAARALAGASEAWLAALIDRGDEPGLKALLADMGSVLKRFSRDEEIGLACARGLVGAAIRWKERARAMESGLGLMSLVMRLGLRRADPVLDEMRASMQLAVASAPGSARLADARRRFEGLTGFQLRSAPEGRSTGHAPRLAVRASGS